MPSSDSAASVSPYAPNEDERDLHRLGRAATGRSHPPSRCGGRPDIGIAIDDRVFDEPELDPDVFYAALAAGCRVTTSQPSPGRFAETYAVAAASGAHEVLSIHTGSSFSGTVGSAELAAAEAPLRVTVVDSGTASVGVGVCVLAAEAALAAGGSAADAVDAISSLAPAIGSVFVATPSSTGRLPAHEGLHVLTLVDGKTEALTAVASEGEAAEAMARHIHSRPGAVRVAVGHADLSVAVAADELAAAVDESAGVRDVLRYRVGPSVGAHTGGRSFGAFWWPA